MGIASTAPVAGATCASTAYACTNGTPASGTAATLNEQNCTGCNTGHRLDGVVCAVNAVNAYVCANGTPAAGLPNAHLRTINRCQACTNGFYLNLTTFACTSTQPSSTSVCKSGSSGRQAKSVPYDAIPHPVFDERPDFIGLYNETWQLARDKVKTRAGLPQNPYVDEAFSDSQIWIWDTLFMTLFTRYADQDLFPGVKTLRNFYAAMHDRVDIPIEDPTSRQPTLLRLVGVLEFQGLG